MGVMLGAQPFDVLARATNGGHELHRLNDVSPGGPFQTESEYKRLREMTMTAVWNGTTSEYVELIRVVERNCSCEFGLMGVRLTRCNAHALTEDQRALNGLLYGRRLAARLRDEEWLVASPLGRAGTPRAAGN